MALERLRIFKIYSYFFFDERETTRVILWWWNHVVVCTTNNVFILYLMRDITGISDYSDTFQIKILSFWNKKLKS